MREVSENVILNWIPFLFNCPFQQRSREVTVCVWVLREALARPWHAAVSKWSVLVWYDLAGMCVLAWHACPGVVCPGVARVPWYGVPWHGVHALVWHACPGLRVLVCVPWHSVHVLACVL